MGAEWLDHPSWELVTEAADLTGRDLNALLLEAGDEELTQTRNAQLATFLVSMVVFDAVQRTGVDAAAHAGHSLGEYSALTASGSLDFEDAVMLVSERGEGHASMRRNPRRDNGSHTRFGRRPSRKRLPGSTMTSGLQTSMPQVKW